MTANGIIFLLLEDETGLSNLLIRATSASATGSAC